MNLWQRDNKREKPERFERSFYDKVRTQFSIHPHGRTDRHRRNNRLRALRKGAATNVG